MHTKLSATFAFFFATIFTCIMCSSSCDNEITNPSTAELNSAFKVSLKDKVLINKDFVVTLDSVKDSRCPEGVQCIWAGFAEAKISISKVSEPSISLNLCLGQCDKDFKTEDEKEFSLSGVDYLLQLSAINPYPKVGDTTKRMATLIVKKK
ncbi:MAG: hypothetical protein ABI390_00365 [Daejeonella sp.]